LWINFYHLFVIVIQGGERVVVKKKHGEIRTIRCEEALTRWCISDGVRNDTWFAYVSYKLCFNLNCYFKYEGYHLFILSPNYVHTHLNDKSIFIYTSSLRYQQNEEKARITFCSMSLSTNMDTVSVSILCLTNSEPTNIILHMVARHMWQINDYQIWLDPHKHTQCTTKINDDLSS
jgi:hypothetical protein